MDFYYSIAQPQVGFWKEKGSKFLAYAYPFENPNELKPILEQLSKTHPKACHSCFAYRLGNAGQTFRYSDDGEPSGTAGKPIYNALLSAELTNVLLVVVRYFGGTLLGTRGLIDAYGAAAKDTLNNAKEKGEIIQKQITKTLYLRFEYAHLAEVQRCAKRHKLLPTKQLFELCCEMWFELTESQRAEITHDFAQIYGVQLTEPSV